MKLMKISVAVALGAAALLFFAMKCVSEDGSSSQPLPKIAQVSKFLLKDHEGEVFSSSELTGKIWIANFIFSRCAGPCPLMTERLAEIQKEFSSDKSFRYVTISMDPQFDTPEVLKEFGKKHGAAFETWDFLTGEQTKIIDIARNIFKVPADKDPEMHTTRFVLVDDEGSIRGYYDSLDDASFDRLKLDLKRLKK